MMRLKRVRAASSTGSACMRISEKDRIEVIGVLSFMADLAEECVLLDRQFGEFFWFTSRRRAAVCDSSADFASSWLEYSMICAVSSATASRSRTDTLAPPVIWATMACAVAAPTDPASSRSRLSRKSGVGSGSSPVRPCAAAAS